MPTSYRCVTRSLTISSSRLRSIRPWSGPRSRAAVTLSAVYRIYVVFMQKTERLHAGRRVRPACFIHTIVLITCFTATAKTCSSRRNTSAKRPPLSLAVALVNVAVLNKRQRGPDARCSRPSDRGTTTRERAVARQNIVFLSVDPVDGVADVFSCRRRLSVAKTFLAASRQQKCEVYARPSLPGRGSTTAPREMTPARPTDRPKTRLDAFDCPGAGVDRSTG